MNGLYQHYIIDLSSNNNFVQIPTVQGDGNKIRGFEVELIENGIQYTVDRNDCIIAIMGTKPDTKQIVNECSLTTEGYICVDITSQMSAVKGRGDYQIVLMSKSTNSQLKSFPFCIITAAATFDVSYIVSTDEFQLLTRNIVQTGVVIDNANKAISDIRILENTVECAESSRVTAEHNRENAESSRAVAESTRVSNENIRKDNEIARQNAETDRVTAENNRASAESIRVLKENTRISNENERKTNENNREAAEAERANAEANRVKAENSRNSSEDTRVANENARKNAEADRVNAEDDRVTAENTRKSNETTRQNNEAVRQSNESERQTNTAVAIADTNKATNRANKAAEACEGIIDKTGVVLQSEKDIANGVATLDANQKLKNEQLPVATNNVLGAVKIGNNITNSNGTISISKTNVTNALGFTPIKQTDTTTELVSFTEPSSGMQHTGDFWLQEY